MADITAEEAVSLIKAMGDLKTATVWAVVVIVALVCAYLVIAGWLGNLSAQRVERRKEERQKAYLAAVNRLGADIRAHMDTDQQSMRIIESALADNKKILRSVQDRQAGHMEFDPSLKVLDVFFSSVATNASIIFAKSLEENDYENRKALVSAKMKHACARLIDDAINGLSELQLAFDLNLFFRVYEDAETGGSRYMLCDQMWDTVEPLYVRHHEPLKNRLEEMKVMLSNAVRDQYSHISRRLIEKQGRVTKSLRKTKDDESTRQPVQRG